MRVPGAQRAWRAPRAHRPLDARLRIPGSKSLTNRALILAALADSPTVLRRPLHSRDTALMADGLRAMGVRVDEVAGDGAFGPDLRVTPGMARDAVTVDVGLAGTAMRFLPFVAALGVQTVTFDGDPYARKRPMRETIESLRALGVEVDDGGRCTLPFTVRGRGNIPGGALEIDAGRSSQFVSALLLAAPAFTDGLQLCHTGEQLPSLPHIDMTVEALRERGVTVAQPDAVTWHVPHGAIAGGEYAIEPDLSNAAPFLTAPLFAGGSVTVLDWPAVTTQVGSLYPALLADLGAQVTIRDGACRVSGGWGLLGRERWSGGHFDLSHAGELAVTFAVAGAACGSPLTISGVGHIRGHETDRLTALATNLAGAGIRCDEGAERVTVHPWERRDATGTIAWRAFADHRMATAGALLGLIADVDVDDIGATNKTIPEFRELWEGMVA